MSVFQTTIKLLSDLIPTRALETTLLEAAKQAGKTPEQMGMRDIERVLKSTVYRQLQLSVPAALAKSRIQQTINALADLDTTEERSSNDDGLQKQAAVISTLEETLRKFGLYFDWPEFQKFRSTLGVIRDEHAGGRIIASLLREAGVLRDTLERKLAEFLVGQARDLTELKTDYERVRTLGGPKVRRLDTLIGQIGMAQESSTLAPAEIERARKLASELRKLVESSVVGAPLSAIVESGPPSSIDAVTSSSSEFIMDLEVDEELVLDLGPLEGLSSEAGVKLLDIDLEEQARTLDALRRDFEGTLVLSPLQAAQYDRLLARHENRELVRGDLDALRETLRGRLDTLREEQRVALSALVERLQTLEEAGLDSVEAMLSAHVADGTLIAGALITSELGTLEEMTATLEKQANAATQARSVTAARDERLLSRQKDALEEYAVLGSSTQTPELLALRNELEQATQAGLAAEETLRTFLETQAKVMGEQQEKGVLAQLRALKSRLSALPELPDLEFRIAQTKAELQEVLKSSEAGQDPQNVTELLIQAAMVLSDASQAVYARLDALEEEARAAGAKPLAERIGGYKGAETYPDLLLLETEVRAARENFQLETQRELRELETAAAQYRSSEDYAAFTETLLEVRTQLGEGHIVDLSELWSMLENLSSAQEDQRAGLDARAAYIFEEYNRLRGLEGDTIQALGRLSSQLRNLSGLGQMSPDALKTYVGTLEKAESLLNEAQAEYEAAREVVSGFGDGGALEGLLGIFDSFTFGEGLGSGGPAQKAVEAPLVLIDKVEGLLKDRLKDLSEDPGVESVALVQRGELKFGRLSSKGGTALQDFEHYIREASGEMNRPLPRLVTLEHASGAAIVLLYPAFEIQLLVNASSVTQSTRLLGMLQKGYEEIGKLL